MGCALTNVLGPTRKKGTRPSYKRDDSRLLWADLVTTLMAAATHIFYKKPTHSFYRRGESPRLEKGRLASLIRRATRPSHMGIDPPLL